MLPNTHPGSSEERAVSIRRGLFSALVLLGLAFTIGKPHIGRAEILERWTTQQVLTNSMGFTQVLYANGCFVAAGAYSDTGGFYTSQDGFHWTFQFEDANSWGLTLTYSDGHFVSVCPWLIVLTSTNGTNWSQSELPRQYVYEGQGSRGCITYGAGTYVWGGQARGVGVILTSVDAVHWSAPMVDPGLGGPIEQVIFAANKFVAVGRNDACVYVSEEGSADFWTRFSVATNYCLTYFNGIFFAQERSGGLAGTNLLSSDALTWTPIPTGISESLSVFTYVKGLFMAVTSGSRLATSTDGTNWVLYARAMPLMSLPACDGTRLVSVGCAVTNLVYYDSFVRTSEPLVSVQMANAPTQSVALSGLVGRNYQIQSAEDLTPAANWLPRITLRLTNAPFLWTDATATNSQRFYRGVLLP